MALSAVDRVGAQAVAMKDPILARTEIFGGYSSIGAHSVGNGPAFRLQGGSLSAAVSMNNWLSVVGALGFYRQGNIAGTGFSLNLHTYEMGGRASWQNRKGLTPFGELLLGVGRAGGSLYTRSLGLGSPPLGPNHSLLLTAGGGADWKLSSKMKLRLVEFECLQSYFLNGAGYDNRQRNLKLSTGLVYNFGAN